MNGLMIVYAAALMPQFITKGMETWQQNFAISRRSCEHVKLLRFSE